MNQNLAALIFLSLLVGCGHYGPPLAPENFSPQSIEKLQVEPSVQGVKFSWAAPQSDQRGKELKSIDGYQIFRREFAEKSDINDQQVQYDEVGMVPDLHIVKRDELRAKAMSEGKISHKIKGDPSLTKFNFTDFTAKPGLTYLYKIVPINQGGIRGAVSQLVKVQYRGESSQVAMIKPSDFEANGEEAF